MSESVPKDDLVTQNFLKRDESTWRITENLENFLARAEEFDAVFYVGGWGRKYFSRLDLPFQPILEEIF
jgi:hypothetical protein